MALREIENMKELKSLEGQEVAVGDWFEVKQDRIDSFADATEDHQWIHIDAERSKKDSPFGGTIAHGYLTLSLFPYLISNAYRIKQKFKPTEAPIELFYPPKWKLNEKICAST